MTKPIIGIMGAMSEEIDILCHLLENRQQTIIGGRVYHSGSINGISTVIVFSRWGKVAAATTVTSLIVHFNITELIFTGVAGAVHPNINIGDIVLGKRLLQHDMDARPLMPRFEIPLLGKTYFESATNSFHLMQQVAESFLSGETIQTIIATPQHHQFGIHRPKLWIGDIASGDQFFADNQAKQDLRNILPDILCVEMEGAAVAQVCYEYQIPFLVIRTISDKADESATVDFPLFIKEVSSFYSLEMIRSYFQQHNQTPVLCVNCTSRIECCIYHHSS